MRKYTKTTVTQHAGFEGMPVEPPLLAREGVHASDMERGTSLTAPRRDTGEPPVERELWDELFIVAGK